MKPRNSHARALEFNRYRQRRVPGKKDVPREPTPEEAMEEMEHEHLEIDVPYADRVAKG